LEKRVSKVRTGEVRVTEVHGAEIKVPECCAVEVRLETLLRLVQFLSFASFRNNLQCSVNVRALYRRRNLLIFRDSFGPNHCAASSCFHIGWFPNELGQYLHDRDVISLDRILGYERQGLARPDTRARIFCSQHFNHLAIAVSYLALLNHIYLTEVYSAPPKARAPAPKAAMRSPIFRTTLLRPLLVPCASQ
jgi:hypothetical protein